MRALYGFLGLWLLAFAAAAAADAHPAQDLVRQTTDRVLERIAAEREALSAEPERIYPLVEDLVLPHFDFEAMSRMVLAKYWRGADPRQRGAFTEQFRSLLVRTYATALLEYTGQQVAYEPVHAGGDERRVSVGTRIERAGGPPIPIDYRLYLTDAGWKVYDISVDGVSLLLNYRTSYGSEVRRHGLDALIRKMAEHNGAAGG